MPLKFVRFLVFRMLNPSTIPCRRSRPAAVKVFDSRMERIHPSSINGASSSHASLHWAVNGPGHAVHFFAHNGFHGFAVLRVLIGRVDPAKKIVATWTPHGSCVEVLVATRCR